MKALRLRHALAAAAAGVALAFWWRAEVAGPLPLPQVPAVWTADAPTRAAAPPVQGSNAQSVRGAPAIPCAPGSLRWQLSLETAACFATRVSSVDTGSLRRDQIDSLLGDGRWLRVDSVGRRVVAVQAGEGAATYGCNGSACRGVSITERDLQGVRRLVVADLHLNAEAGAAAGLQVNGSVEIVGRVEDDPACAGQSLMLSRGDGVVSGFCPQDGTSRSVEDDGSTRHVYADLEGRAIAVRVDAQGGLLGIASGDAGCAASECAGAEVSRTDAQGGRILQLRGTMLQGASGWILLDGMLLLAP
jgi:hypothetical protein